MSIPPSTCRQSTPALLAWYAESKRGLPWRRTGDPYAIWVSEVMLQQTQVKTVIPYYLRFMGLFPTVAQLAAADLQQVLKVWEGLGYYSRARNLHRAAQMVTVQLGGSIPDQRDMLRLLPGIGDYIAAAVASIAFGQPCAVLDGNVKRVLARLYTLAAPVNQASSHKEFQTWADRLLDPLQPGEYNQAMMELGALVCLPRNPCCGQCPLAPDCRSLAAGVIAAYPQRTRRRPIPHQELVAAVVWKGDRLLLTRRPAQGLLGGLWELPGAIVDPDLEPESACAAHIKASVNLDITVQRRLTVVNHTYTHLKIRLTVYECRWQRGAVRLNGPSAFQWIDPQQIDQYALHKAIIKAWPHVIDAQKGILR